MIRFLVLFISILVCELCLAVTPVVSNIKGFHEWKTEKIQTATMQISTVRGQIYKSINENNRKNAESLEKQLDQLKWNMEVAQDLTVADYFVLYLSKQTQADRFTQAAQKLTTKEVAELMEAYANTLGSAPSEIVARPSARPGILDKIPSQAIQARDQFK